MIFISGGGNYKQTEMLDSIFFNNSHHILYIPIGLTRNFSGYEGCWSWFKTVCQYHHFEMDDVDMCLYLNDMNYLDNYDGIYIGGASNVHSLMELFTVSGFCERLKRFYKSGGNIYGGSAGGLILGKNMPKYDEKGFSLLPFSIISHYVDGDVYIKSHFHKNEEPLVVLKEDSGIIYDNHQITSIGDGEVLLFYSPDDPISLHNNFTATLL